MRMSPARAHFLRKTAESESATPNRENLEGLQGYDLVLAQLKAHQRQLKKIQSIERKIEFKRNNFEQYRPWVEGSLAKGSGVQDTVITTMLIWSIDIGDYPTALAIAQYVLMHDLQCRSSLNAHRQPPWLKSLQRRQRKPETKNSRLRQPC